MRIAICDDLASDRAGLMGMVQRYCAAHGLEAEIEQFQNAGELLRRFTPRRYGILFLDIYMPGMSGMEAARQIRRMDPECMLVFSTTSEEHALESYGVYAAGYLLKPYDQGSLDETLDWCIQNLPAQPKTYEIVSERERIRIPLEEIVFIEIYGRDGGAAYHRAGVYAAPAALPDRGGTA